MIKRRYTDRDGDCFGTEGIAECSALTDRHKDCGSYKCPFYKPSECGDWIKIEKPKHVELYAPEEYYSGGEQQR